MINRSEFDPDFMKNLFKEKMDWKSHFIDKQNDGMKIEMNILIFIIFLIIAIN